MKLSSNPADSNGNIFPIADWQPNDFLTHSLIDLTPSAETMKQAQSDVRGKKIISLKEALALLQPALIKLPIVDAPRYRKVVRQEEGEAVVTFWQPLEFSSASQPQTISQEMTVEEVEAEPEPTEEDLARQGVMQAEIEQKLNQANATLEQAQIQAETTLNQAREEAGRIMAEAHSAVEQIRKLAYDEGMLAARVQVEKQIEQITVIIKETQTWRSQILEHSEPMIIRMVQTISKKLFGSGFVLDAAGVEQMVGRAINEANRLGNLRIYVSVEDYNLLLSLWQESDLVINGQKIQLVSSQNIVKGGCFVEGDFGSVDSRIDMQLERLERELNGTLSNREQEKQRQMDFTQVEKNALDKTLNPPVNLDSLDQVRLNLGKDNGLADSSQENYGFDTTAQPE